MEDGKLFLQPTLTSDYLGEEQLRNQPRAERSHPPGRPRRTLFTVILFQNCGELCSFVDDKSGSDNPVPPAVLSLQVAVSVVALHSAGLAVTTDMVETAAYFYHGAHRAVYEKDGYARGSTLSLFPVFVSLARVCCPGDCARLGSLRLQG